MKKTLTVNLNGRVFNIDEDAYELLDNYLRNLRIYFSKEEGYAEIISDFEARIEELFSERIKQGYEVISIEQVETVIKQIGKPEDFGDTGTSDAGSKKQAYGGQPAEPSEEKKFRKKYYRDIDNKMLGGVCAGLAAYFGLDVTPVRLIFVILLFVPYGWMIVLYLALWIIVPGAKTAKQKLEMRGEEVSVENIGKIVSEETIVSDRKNENSGCLGAGLNFIATTMKVILIGLGILIGIPVAFVLVILLIVIFAVLFGVGGGLLSIPLGFGPGIGIANFTVTHPTLALIAAILIVAIPLVLLIYSIVAHFAKLTPLPNSVKWTGFIVWILSVGTLIFCGFHIDIDENRGNWHRHKWNISWNNRTFGHVIEGNGVMEDRTDTLPPFDVVKLDEDLMATIQLEQRFSDTTKVVISGDSNLLDKIAWRVSEHKLKFFVKDDYRLNPKSNIVIKVTARDIRGVEVESIGNITAPGKLETDRFYVEIDGAGNFHADSLYCTHFNADLEGVGNLEVAGKASEANLKLKGAGRIKALNLETNTVVAILHGVGAISCHPVQSLDASVEGIGQITYKSEPVTKSVRLNGMGKVDKE